MDLYKKMEKMLSKDMLDLLKEKNMKPEDFITQNDFGGFSVRGTQEALDAWNVARLKDIAIWR